MSGWILGHSIWPLPGMRLTNVCVSLEVIQRLKGLHSDLGNSVSEARAKAMEEAHGKHPYLSEQVHSKVAHRLALVE